MDTGALVEAIREHCMVELGYRGDPPRASRLVQPHILFRTTTGAIDLAGLQVAGYTRSGHLPAWRQFHLIGINHTSVLAAGFEPAPDFDRAADKYRAGVLASA